MANQNLDIDYESLGKWLKRIRTRHKLTQLDVASQYFHVERSVYAKYESGTVHPDWNAVVEFARAFQEDPDEIRKKISLAIPDTSALFKNLQLLQMLLCDYNEIVIPSIVLTEVNFQKDHAKSKGKKRAAWQILSQIHACALAFPERFQILDTNGLTIPKEIRKNGSRNMRNDAKIIALAQKLQKKVIGDVVVITEDIDFASRYPGTLQLKDYVISRNRTRDYETILQLDREYQNFSPYEERDEPLNLNAFLPDGMTLLIHCIRHKDPVRSQASSRPDSRFASDVKNSPKYRKLRWLIAHGADLNQNDNARYCLSPLAHCIQVDDWMSFTILLQTGCDYNKGSCNETVSRHLKLGAQNEGNTPLMIACWHGKTRYVHRLCQLPDLCLNQQDSNGYTALIKCAVARVNARKAGQSSKTYETLYRYLLKQGADPRIRDRNNLTAKDWWDSV